jgi:threonyl-tRNA synthetase
VAVIMGEQEVTDGTATVRDLGRGEQEVVPRDQVVDRVRKILETPASARKSETPASPASADTTEAE